MYLIDTNIVSDAEKRVPAPTQWLSAADPTQIYLSVVTLGEIARGITRIQELGPAEGCEAQRMVRGTAPR